MTYPDQCKTMGHMILHFIHTKGPTERKDILIREYREKSVFSKVSDMIKFEQLTKMKDDRIVLTEKGLLAYSTLMDNTLIPVVSPEEVMMLFPIGGKPKTIKDIMTRFFNDLPSDIVRDKARYIVSRLLKLDKIRVVDFIDRYKYYANTKSPLVVKREKAVNVELVKKQEIYEANVELLRDFYYALPGTLTASEDGWKPYLY